MPTSNSASACPLTTAARWNTLSVSGVIVLSISAASARSPTTEVTRSSATRAGATSTRTIREIARSLPRASVSFPRCSSSRASRVPRKPAPPVMTMRMSPP